jgi:hypothetical protein
VLTDVRAVVRIYRNVQSIGDLAAEGDPLPGHWPSATHLHRGWPSLVDWVCLWTGCPGGASWSASR